MNNKTITLATAYLMYKCIEAVQNCKITSFDGVSVVTAKIAFVVLKETLRPIINTLNTEVQLIMQGDEGNKTQRIESLEKTETQIAIDSCFPLNNMVISKSQDDIPMDIVCSHLINNITHEK